MKRKMTKKEMAKVAYFVASLVFVCVACETIPLAILAIANLVMASRTIRTIKVDELIED